MAIALWVVQGLIAIAYLIAGFMKSTQPLLGAIGLILPAITGILPWLTVAAAVGLVIVQVCAGIYHASRREYASLPANLVLLVLAAVVVYGRVVVFPV